MTTTVQSHCHEAHRESTPRVDLTQPILRQVGELGDAYDAWVHGALSQGDLHRGRREPARGSGSLRIFEHDLLESLTHIPWWIVPLIWVPVAAGLFAAGVLMFDRAALTALPLALLGVAIWTLLEYGLHRFVFHHKPTTRAGRRVHFLAHGVHHLDPRDPTRLVAPPLGALLIAAPTFGLAVLALGLAAALPLMGGILLGYVIYDLTHYYTHHAKPTTRVGRYLKAWHLAHHHRHWERMFGVSSPLWDIVFRTGRPERG